MKKQIDWELVDYFPDRRDQKALRKDFKFKDFKQALDFVNKVGSLAEEVQHHPDINLGWGYAQVWLTSHSEHTVTEKDHKLAAEIDKFIGNRSKATD